MEFLLLLPPLLLAVTVHEAAHAWVALREGDPTADRLGRVTLNPIPHLDPVGSVLVPLVLYILPGGFLFGWARPVPVDPSNFRSLRGGEIRVALAGIVANLILAVAFTGLLSIGLGVAGRHAGTSPLEPVLLMARFGIFINLLLAFFNLIPIPPLDGSHVMRWLLPARTRASFQSLGRYGFVLLLLSGIFFPGILATLLFPVEWLFRVAVGVASLATGGGA